jgi:hypothetical protein
MCICYISCRPVTTAPHVTRYNLSLQYIYVWKEHNSLIKHIIGSSSIWLSELISIFVA